MFEMKQVFDEQKRKDGIVVYSAAENGKNIGSCEAKLDGDRAVLLSLSASPADPVIEDGLVRAVLARCETLGATVAVVPDNDTFAVFRRMSAMSGERADIASLLKQCGGCQK